MADGGLELVREQVAEVAADLRASADTVAAAAAQVQGCFSSAATTGRRYGTEGGALVRGTEDLVGAVRAWSVRSEEVAAALLGAVDTLAGADRAGAQALPDVPSPGRADW